MASHDSAAASPHPKRRLSVVSSLSSVSSTVTLTNSPNDPEYHDLPTHDPSFKRRKSVTFSAVAQVITSEYVWTRDGNLQPDVAAVHHPHKRPLSYSNLNSNSSLATSSTTSSEKCRHGSQANGIPVTYSTQETRSSTIDPTWFPSPDKRLIFTSVQPRPIPTPPKRVSFAVHNPETPQSQSASASLSHHHTDSQNRNSLKPQLQQRQSHPQLQPQQREPLHQTQQTQPQPQRQPPQLSPHKRKPQPEQSQPQPEPPLILTPSTKLPPSEVCDEINADIRHSATLNCKTFDFAEHVQRRRYVVRRRWLNAAGSSLSRPSLAGTRAHSRQDRAQECVTMLDASVDALFPSHFPAPPFVEPDLFTIQPAFASLPSYSPPSYPSPLPPILISNGPISIAKGLGMFALLPIASNQLISAERPVVITPYLIALSTPLEEAYERVFGMLEGELTGRVGGLARFWHRPNVGGGEETKQGYEAIVKTNALAIELSVPEGNNQEQHGELKTHKGMFFNTSRINHSCSPNAKWEWDLKTHSLLVSAVRPITAGEEITISYVPPYLPYDLRRDKLYTMYGFDCVCPTCLHLAVHPGSDSEEKYMERVQESDAARRMLTGFWDGSANGRGRGCVTSMTRPSFKRWCTDPLMTDDALISAHVQALDLIRREGLEILDTHPGSGVGSASVSYSAHKSNPNTQSDVRVHPLRDLGRHIDIIAMCYGAREDVVNFRLWIGQAADARGFGLKEKENESKEEGPGKESRETKEERLAFMRWMANPLSFPAWGWREKGIQDPAGGARSNATGSWDLNREEYSPAGLRDCMRLGLSQWA